MPNEPNGACLKKPLGRVAALAHVASVQSKKLGDGSCLALRAG
jgi:hypothetical protein